MIPLNGIFFDTFFKRNYRKNKKLYYDWYGWYTESAGWILPSKGFQLQDLIWSEGNFLFIFCYSIFCSLIHTYMFTYLSLSRFYCFMLSYFVFIIIFGCLSVHSFCLFGRKGYRKIQLQDIMLNLICSPRSVLTCKKDIGGVAI